MTGLPMLFAAQALAAAVPAAAAAPPPPQTVQGLFDAATAAEDKGDLKGSLATYRAIETRLSGKNGRSFAIVRLREGDLLYRLGQTADAQTALKAGLAGLPAADPSLGEDIARAYQDLGTMALADFDPADAIAAYDQALAAAPDPSSRINALSGRAKAHQFLDPVAALADTDAALKVATDAKASKQLVAQLTLLRGRMMLTQGDKAVARTTLNRAVTEMGGLTSKVRVADLAARSDLGMAEMLGGNADTAHRDFAYAAAGHLDHPFALGADMAPPPCGLSGLKPEDMAVVEFSLRNDGSVGNAQPVYANRLGLPVYEFARAVQGWSWTPKTAAQIEPFFRLLIRVELRCSTAAEHPAVLAALKGDVDAWLSAKGVEAPETAGSDAADAAMLRAELAKRQTASAAPAAQLPVLSRLADSSVIPVADRADYARRAEAISSAERAPVPAQAWYAIAVAGLAGEAKKSVGAERTALRALLARPAFAADPRASAALKLLIAEDHYNARAPTDADSLLMSVANDDRLDRTDALRIGALTRLATIEARQGDLARAREAYAKTGLTDQQCALVDATPVLKASGASSADFPEEALRWGFDGWVVTQSDVRADGHTANQRIIASYPPLVFDEAGIGIARDARYTQSYRPQGSIGCTGQTTRINFRKAR